MRSVSQPLTLTAVAATLVAACALGGSAAPPDWALIAIELSALPALMVVLAGPNAAAPRARLAQAMLALGGALALLQLIPMPPSIWTALPGRGPVLAVVEATGGPTPWLPISFSPRETLRSALALLAPAAVFMGAVQLDERRRRRLAGLILAIAGVGLLLGAAQVVGGERGPYLWHEAPRGALVGLFGNRNHFASVLVASLVLAAGLAAATESDEPFLRWGAVLFVPAAVIGLGLLRSRAGVVLGAPALLAAGALLWRGNRAPDRRAGAAVLGVLLAVVVIAVAGAGGLIRRFAEPADNEFRFQAWPHVISAAKAYFPVGAGVGAFSRAYAPFEPVELLQTQGFEHAHNEYLEAVIEGGLAGAVLAAALVAWTGAAAWRAWKRSRGDPLAAAAGVAALLMLAHAGIDFALRTTAAGCLLACLCGLLVQRAPPSAAESSAYGALPNPSPDDYSLTEGARASATEDS